MTKRIISLMLALLLVAALLLVGCANKPVDPGKPEETKANSGEKKLRVALIVELLGDNAINDFCYEGASKAAAEFGIELKALECEDTSQYEPQLLAACEGGYDLVICSASPWADYLKIHASEYPDIMFGIIDDVVDEPNVVSIGFANNQGSFLAGAAAAKFTTMEGITGVNPDKVIGWVGSKDMPVLWDFFVGFEQGAKYVDPDIQILQAFAGSSTDPLKGKELTLAQYAQGADIVMAVAAATGNGVLEASADEGLYSIGVDLDQDAEQPGHVMTSMVKHVDTACYMLIEAMVKNTFKGGEHWYLDLSNGGVSLTDMSVIRDNVPAEEAAKYEELLAFVEDLKAKIISGEIVVENYEGFGPDA